MTEETLGSAKMIFSLSLVKLYRLSNGNACFYSILKEIRFVKKNGI